MVPVFNPLRRTNPLAIATRMKKYTDNRARRAMEVIVWGASRILAQPWTKASHLPGPIRSGT